MKIYTDGACSSTDKTGGWATVVVTHQQPNVNCHKMDNHNITIFENGFILSGSEQPTTNNAMELTAVEWALIAILTNDGETSHTIYTDSAYVANCFKDKWYVKWERNGWINSKREPIANKELWQQILRIYNGLISFGHTINFIHVKGHGDNEYNNLADRYAVTARLSLRN